jgi:triphosphatase
MPPATPAQQQHQEIELKLLAAPEDAERLEGHPLLQQHASAAPYSQQLISTYYDTPDGQLRQHGWSLRVRRLDHSFVQSLKEYENSQGDAGLYRRKEIETGVDGPGIDLAALRAVLGKQSPASKLLQQRALEQELRPVFDTRVERTIWELRMADGTEIELAWDRGAIECKDASAPVSEVELELKAGDPATLFGFATELLDTVPMSLAGASKAARGYALCAGAAPGPEPVKFAHVELAPSMTVDDAFRTIAGACLAQVQGNAAGVAGSPEPEYVHQMRVGLRRLKSALGLFRNAIALPAPLQEELDWLEAQLGPARDWEVLSHSTLDVVQKAAPPDIGALELPQAAAALAQEQRAAAAGAVQSVRYARLILAFQRWLHGAEWRQQEAQWKRSQLGSPVLRFADKELARAERRLLRRGRKLRGADPQRRHQVRIAAKKTRYAMEFFQSLYPARAVKKFVAALSSLQDELGRLNDAAVGDGLLRELHGRRPELGAAVGFARGYLGAMLEHKDRRLDKLWRRFQRLQLPSHH